MTLVDGLFTGEHGLIDLLRVGEIGDGLIPIIESVTEFDYDLLLRWCRKSLSPCTTQASTCSTTTFS